ncbi:MAG: hypothetical protein U0792_01610 [Gemmataceae bacterium]
MVGIVLEEDEQGAVYEDDLPPMRRDHDSDEIDLEPHEEHADPDDVLENIEVGDGDTPPVETSARTARSMPARQGGRAQQSPRALPPHLSRAGLQSTRPTKALKTGGTKPTRAEIAREVERERAAAAALEAEQAEAEAEETAAEAEAKEAADKQKAVELAAIAARAEELRKKNEAEEAKKLAELKAKKQNTPAAKAARRKRNFKYAVIAVGTLFVVFWAYEGVMAVLPPPSNPFTTYTAEEFTGSYAKDPADGDEKFFDKRIAIRGKLKLVREKNAKTGPAKIYLDAPGKEGVKFEVQFAGEDVSDNIKEGTDYLINSKPARFKPGTGVVLRESNFMPESK